MQRVIGRLTIEPECDGFFPVQKDFFVQVKRHITIGAGGKPIRLALPEHHCHIGTALGCFAKQRPGKAGAEAQNAVQQPGLFLRHRNAKEVLQLVIAARFDLRIDLGHHDDAAIGLAQRERQFGIQNAGFTARGEHPPRLGIAGDMAGTKGQLGAETRVGGDRDEIGQRVRQIAFVGASIPQMPLGQTVRCPGELIGQLLVLP